MRTKQIFVTILFVCSCALAGYSQLTYKSALGLRAGIPPAVTYKHVLGDRSAIEAFAGYAGYSYYSWFTVGATYQFYFPIGSIEGFNWFVGGGGGAQFWTYDYDSGYGSTSFAVLGIGGVDYKFAKIPLNVSADIMPAFFFGSNLYYSSSFRAGYGAVSARYVFK